MTAQEAPAAIRRARLAAAAAELADQEARVRMARSDVLTAVREARSAGVPVAEIARLADVARVTVYQWLTLEC